MAHAMSVVRGPKCERQVANTGENAAAAMLFAPKLGIVSNRYLVVEDWGNTIIRLPGLAEGETIHR